MEHLRVEIRRDDGRGFQFPLSAEQANAWHEGKLDAHDIARSVWEWADELRVRNWWKDLDLDPDTDGWTVSVHQGYESDGSFYGGSTLYRFELNHEAEAEPIQPDSPFLDGLNRPSVARGGLGLSVPQSFRSGVGLAGSVVCDPADPLSMVTAVAGPTR
ncbi:hypothetical protein [Bifidobacterium aerophilum]|uniref:Uncharacterized protein n=1 Tax=Bifidobacterium aerophilum TaxID=1798155 RepID=A0A6N9Z8J5_9BIFI|nr:hypothetical protein [Bifidobacterium aerophilum]NEG90604.1 hypothetical protein [Bifidobacterium aerophilum]